MLENPDGAQVASSRGHFVELTPQVLLLWLCGTVLIGETLHGTMQGFRQKAAITLGKPEIATEHSDRFLPYVAGVAGSAALIGAAARIVQSRRKIKDSDG